VFCSTCGQNLRAGAQFCDQCGTSMELPGAVTQENPTRSTHAHHEIKDPYKEQITQLKLEIKQLKLELKQVNTGLSNTRAQHNETAAFLPRGALRRGYKWLEDIRLLGPQQQKQSLQQEVMTMEQELLNLEQAQAQWRLQHQE
jgi:uncharacterized protein involved in exopolysaccharide biosynthesis